MHSRKPQLMDFLFGNPVMMRSKDSPLLPMALLPILHPEPSCSLHCDWDHFYTTSNRQDSTGLLGLQTRFPRQLLVSIVACFSFKEHVEEKGEKERGWWQASRKYCKIWIPSHRWKTQLSPQGITEMVYPGSTGLDLPRCRILERW